MSDTPTDSPAQTRTRTQPNRRARRVKTFSGCMTCRSRHVKCDEQRPTCQRCSDSQLECAGYPGYRVAVHWKPVRGPSDWGAPKPRRHSQPQTTASPNSSAIICSPHPPPQLAPGSPAGTELTPTSHINPHPSPVTRQQVESLSVNCALPPLFPSPRAGSQDLSSIHLEENCEHEQNDHTPGRNTGCSPSGSIDIVPPIHMSLEQTCHRNPGVPQHIDLLTSMHLQRSLLEHWVTHLSDALSSVPGSKSPLKRIFVPIAYAGALSPASSSTGSVALFHLICSAAAFHLSVHLYDEKEKSDFMTLGLSHHNQGIHHLQHNLVQDDPGQREPVLASLLMCLTYEPVTVERDFWLTHLRGASQWLHRVSINSWAHRESTLILYQMLASTATMLRSQILSEDVARDENFHFDVADMLEPYYLHEIFGLPKKLFKAISDMIAMAVRLCNGTLGEADSVDLDRLEMELFLSVPQDVHVPGATQGQDDLVHHYAQIFYFGSIIYCKRRLRNSPVRDVQPLVEQAFQHIEALTNYNSRPYTPILWPIAVTFFEMQDLALRKRAMLWLDFMIKQSTISIWQKAKPLIDSLWEERKIPGQEEVHWDTFLSSPTTPSIMIV